MEFNIVLLAFMFIAIMQFAGRLLRMKDLPKCDEKNFLKSLLKISQLGTLTSEGVS